MAYTKWFALWCFVIMLVACGDDGCSTNAVEMDTSFDASKFDVVVATKDELPKCTDKRDCERAYVKDEKAIYICEVDFVSFVGRWVLDNEDEAKSSSSDMSSSSVNKNSSSSSEYKPYDGEVRKADTTDYYYKYDEVLNEWVWLDVFGTDRDLGLNGCTHKREGEIGLSPKDDSYYVCKHFVDKEDGLDYFGWRTPQEIDFIKRDNKCESEDVGRIIPGIDTVTNNYYCSIIGWVNLRTWSFGVPKEFRFNPDINYGSLKDERDGKTYKTVKIGGQVWMAENLNYAGGGIGHCYEDVPENCEVAGRLYKWDVAREVCPEGWHLPSKAEFDTLLSFVKLTYDEDECSLPDMFRATSGWNYGGQGCDKTGFSAVPAGGKHINAYRSPEYNHAGGTAYFLTSTEESKSSVYVMRVGADMASLSIDDYYEDQGPCYSIKESGFSVRCLRDAE